MSDFTINIDSKLDISNAKTTIENFITTYNKKTINIDVQLNPNSINTENFGKQIQNQLSNINKTKIKPTIDTSGLKQTTKDFQMIKNLASQISKTKIKIAGLNTSKNSNEISVLQSQLKQLESDYKVLMKTFSSGFSKSQLGSLENIFGNTDDRIAQIKAKAKDLENTFKSTNNIQKQFDTAQSKFNSIKFAFGNSSESVLGKNGYNQIQTYINQATDAMKRFNAEANQGKNANLDSLNADMKEFISLTNKATSEYSKLNAPASAIKQQNTLNDFKRWMHSNSKAYKVGEARYNSIVSNLQGNLTGGQLEDVIGQIKTFKTEMELSGNVGKSFTEELGRSFKKIGIFAGTYGIIQRLAYQVPRQLAKAVLEVDTAMTELRKVSDASGLEITNYFSEATEMAKEYGRTISDVINSTADWSRLGYSLPDSKELARVTSLYQNVGDNMTQESASQSLISTLQGFQLDASEAESIIDKFNEVANNYAIDTAGIGEALQNSAASFNAANTDLSKSIALITGTNEVVQSPSEVGNMWKTVSMRIRSTKQELEEAGEDTDGMVESTSELRELVKGLTGFDIMADEAGTQFKDIYDIVVGIGEAWNNLTDTDQAGLLEALAGKRQGNALAAALNNIETIKEVYNTAEFDSEGSAMKEQEKYAESLQFKLEALKATAQEFANVTLDSDFLKGIVDTAQILLNLLTKLEKFTGLIPLIFGGTAIVKAIKNFGSSNEFALYGCESIVA